MTPIPMRDPGKWRHPGMVGLTILLLCLPLTARADAGTPLIWAGILHLFVGNFIIGLLEGGLLAWIFKLNPMVCGWVMVLANYFSAWVGDVFLAQQLSLHLPLDLYNAWHWLWAMVIVTFMLTLVLEWPFVLFCFRGQPKKFQRSWKGNLLVNFLSYLLIFGWYWMASGTALYTKMNVVRLNHIGLPQSGWVYFISETNTVCKYDFDSHTFENLRPLTSHLDDRLWVRASAVNSNHWDVFDSEHKSLICSNLPVFAAVSERDAHQIEGNQIEGNWFNFGEAVKLARDSDWTYRTGFWPIEGFRGTNQKTGAFVYFSLETPFAAWNVRNATHLPGDYVVFQLGKDQICLFEGATRKIALLTKGHGPVTVLPERPDRSF